MSDKQIEILLTRISNWIWNAVVCKITVAEDEIRELINDLKEAKNVS